MPDVDVNRRSFFKTAVGVGAALAVPNAARVAASKMIGIQVGAISFVDEGTEKAYQGNTAIAEFTGCTHANFEHPGIA